MISYMYVSISVCTYESYDLHIALYYLWLIYSKMWQLLIDELNLSFRKCEKYGIQIEDCTIGQLDRVQYTPVNMGLRSDSIKK